MYEFFISVYEASGDQSEKADMIKDGKGFANSTEVKVERSENFYTKGNTKSSPLDLFDIIWMRKDPPFNMDYIYSTYILELVDQKNTHVINHPKGIRDSNEKLYSLHFKDFAPETFVSKDVNELKGFLNEIGGKMVVKPLDGFGGEGIFFVDENDYNSNVILESITNFGSTYVMAQMFIENVSEGDKRIILLNGEPIGAVLRVAAKGEFRSNFHSGGHPEETKITERDLEICKAVKNKVMEDKLYFVGIDVVGGYLTEVNSTSPTCVQEINFFNKTKTIFCSPFTT